MSTSLSRNLHKVNILVYLGTLLLNYLSALGWVLPYRQEEISDMYANLLAPSSTTFSIWGLIYIGVLLTLILPWVKDLTRSEKSFYHNKLMPLTLAWLLANLLWTVSWNSDWLILALLAIVAYAACLTQLVKRIQAHPDFSHKYQWFVAYPTGLHAGWLVFASFTNVMTVLVKFGLDAFSGLGLVVTVVLMAGASLAVLLLFKQTGNWVVTLPALWALLGIFMKQRPGSDFAQSNSTVMLAALIILVIALGLHFMILSRRQGRSRASR